MDEQVETRTFEVNQKAEQEFARELSSLVRLRFTVKKPSRWKPWDPTVFSVTGPRFALDRLPALVKTIEDNAAADWEW